ncbi:MAG: RtcB family protein [Anaerolineae bacterium]|jgi:tRNA-splicing ligase RtcB
MVSWSDLEQLSPWEWEVPAAFRSDMRTPAAVYMDESLLRQALEDRALEQLVNTATLPGVAGRALAMPDMHQGYGFPIGGVAATRLPEGVVSPGGVGYDINCGVRVLRTSLQAKELAPHMDSLMTALYEAVASGVGAKGSLRLNTRQLADVLHQGAGWAVEQGYGVPADLSHAEDGGCLPHADAAAVSDRALKRGLGQLGTLGAGNHFLEVDRVEQIYDPLTAAAFGLELGEVVVWIHCGSRGLGHQVCTDSVREMQAAVKRYGIEIPDRELVCAPFESPEGDRYYRAMCAAANYAWANRQVISHLVRETFASELPASLRTAELGLVYDVSHNIAKVEEHLVDGEMVQLCVHRKGATRAFGPSRSELPEAYRSVGQPVLIPGDMGTGSYILVGTDKALTATFGSSCHGAGRAQSRQAVRRTVRGADLRDNLQARGIVVRAGSLSGLAEEAPEAYKDVDAVVEVTHEAGLALRVARSVPMGVIKG